LPLIKTLNTIDAPFVLHTGIEKQHPSCSGEGAPGGTVKRNFPNRSVIPFVLTVLLASCLIFIRISIAPAEETTPSPVTSAGEKDLTALTATELAEKIRTRQISSLDAVTAVLKRIDMYNPSLNAIVTLDKAGAIQKAKEADIALQRGVLWGPLHGVPITIKDNLATKGIKTTSSMKEAANFVPDFDATVVERLKKAGAIIVGKTNMPPLGADFQSNSPLFGKACNPWDLTRTPGGSTGGGAAAIAAGLTFLEIGNDIGGSVRIPAHFCGIYSLKPTEHRVSIFGISPGLPQKKYRSIRHLLSCGPLARSIDDLKLALDIIAGPDPKDTDVPYIPPVSYEPKKPATIRIAWSDDFGDVPVSLETRTALEKFTAKLIQAGYTVQKINPPGFDFKTAWNAYGRVIDMETGVYTPSFGRFIQFIAGGGYRKTTPSLEMVYPMSYEKYLKALTELEDCTAAIDRFLTSYDIFLCPVSTTPAFKHITPDSMFGPYPLYKKEFMVDDKPLSYLFANGAYTTPFNLTGNPVVVMPIGYTLENLPVGVQVVGSRWHDPELLSIAKQLDQIAGAYKRPAGF
jgi:amidase